MNFQGHTQYICNSTARLVNEKLLQLKSIASIRNYGNAVDSICNFCKKDFCDITFAEVEQYVEYLQERKRTEIYIKSRLRVLRGIAKFIDEKIGSRLVADVYNGHKIKTENKIYTREELAVLKAVDTVISKLKKAKDDQLIAIINLALESGMATSDIVRITCADLFFDPKGKSCIRLRYPHDSGDWSRNIPVRNITAKRINSFLTVRGPIRKDAAVFVNKKGKQLTGRDVQYMLKKAEEAAGIAKEERFTIQKLNNLAVIDITETTGRKQFEAGYTWFTRCKSITRRTDCSAVGLNCISIR